MKQFASIAALSVLLAGCASMPQPLITPDGKQGYSVSCNGTGDNWPKCYDKANKACGGPYHVLDKNESFSPSPYGVMGKRSLIIQCK